MYELSDEGRKEFALLMRQIEIFCKRNHIYRSRRSDAYYFNIEGKPYVVANRKKKVPEDVKFILASKTRIMDIYEDLASGRKLDARGYREKNLKEGAEESC